MVNNVCAASLLDLLDALGLQQHVYKSTHTLMGTPLDLKSTSADTQLFNVYVDQTTSYSQCPVTSA